MDIMIRNTHGDVLSSVLDVTISPIGAGSITTVHGCFTIDEYSIDYEAKQINAYSTDYGISNQYEGTVNQYGTYLESK